MVTLFFHKPYFLHDVPYDLGITTLLIGISQPSPTFTFDIRQ